MPVPASSPSTPVATFPRAPDRDEGLLREAVELDRAKLQLLFALNDQRNAKSAARGYAMAGVLAGLVGLLGGAALIPEVATHHLGAVLLFCLPMLPGVMIADARSFDRAAREAGFHPAFAREVLARANAIALEMDLTTYLDPEARSDALLQRLR